MKCSSCGQEFSSSSRLTQRHVECPNCGASNTLPGSASDTVVSPSRASALRGEHALQSPESLCGRELADGTYRLVEYLGCGAMGYVYRAVQTSLARDVAVKILSPSLMADREFVGRFEREARTLATMRHPGIVQVIDFKREGDLCFIVMEYVSGPGGRPATLADEIASRGRFLFEEAKGIILEALDAVASAHEAGVVHRDIKPGNFLIDSSGRPRLADFGLASTTEGAGSGMTQMGTKMGTMGYMAPEQARNAAAVDERADVYSMGVVLYELLIGAQPDFAELMSESFRWPSRECTDAPAAIDEVIRKSLHPNRDFRYSSAREMASAIEAAISSPSPVPTPELLREAAIVNNQTSARAVSGRRRAFPTWTSTIGAALVVVALIGIFGPTIYANAKGATGSTPPATGPGGSRPATPQQTLTTSSFPDGREAAQRGSAADVKGYFGQHPDELKATDADGRTPLHFAAARGDLSVVSAIIDAGADPTIADKMGRTPLHYAAARPWDRDDKQADAIVRLLGEKIVAAHGSIDAQDTAGDTALHAAAVAGNEPNVDALLKLGANRSIANARGLQPADVVKISFDALKTKLRGGTMVTFAQSGDAAAVRDLIRRDPKLINEADAGGNTPLLVALRNCHFDVARLLIDNVAHVNQQAADGQTPLRLVCESQCALLARAEMIELAQRLVDHGARVEWRTADGGTLLHTLAAQGDAELIEVVAKACDPTERNAQGLTAICVADSANLPADRRDATLRALERAGSRLDCSDLDGNSALAKAALRGDKDRMIELIRQGTVSINAPNKKGETPLHVAIRARQVDAVKLLLSSQADPLAVDNDKNTALHAAAQAGEIQIAQLVLERSKRLGDTNSAGLTPAQIAQAAGHHAIADLFTPAPAPKVVLPQNFNMVGTWVGTFTAQSGQAVNISLTIHKVGAQGAGSIRFDSGPEIELNTLFWNPEPVSPRLKILAKTQGPKLLFDPSAKPLTVADGSVVLQSPNQFTWRVTDPAGDATLTRQ